MWKFHLFSLKMFIVDLEDIRVWKYMVWFGSNSFFRIRPKKARIQIRNTTLRNQLIKLLYICLETFPRWWAGGCAELLYWLPGQAGWPAAAPTPQGPSHSTSTLKLFFGLHRTSNKDKYRRKDKGPRCCLGDRIAALAILKKRMN